MKFTNDKIKAVWPFKKQEKKAKTEYTDLAPIDKIENGAEYLNALEWALGNKRVRNIALAGPYGSGKSSIIETYLKKHPSVQKKSLRISMATFAELDKEGSSPKIEIEQEEIELGILKQLFYKVKYSKIPQSRYRKLHKISFWRIWSCLAGLCITIFLLSYIFLPGVFSTAVDKIVAAISPIVMTLKLTFIEPSVFSLIFFGILALGILAVFSNLYRSVSSRFKVKEIRLPADTAVRSGEETSDSVFNKNIDEIVYFFEETKYRVVFFEDLDRLEDSSVFVHLRELNTLLNNYNAIKKPIIFVYAVKDDVFTDADRTKFFEFIVPVIPIINSTNSGEILLEKLEHSKRIGIQHNISQSYVLDIAPYISDMRILQNIYNEFIVYKKTLRVEQGLKLLDEPMMALIIFKNLYPRDFSLIQMEKGVIKQAFSDKQTHLKPMQDNYQNEIDELTGLLNRLPTEALKSIQELKTAFLSEITDWQGFASDIRPAGKNQVRASVVMQSDFSLSQWSGATQCFGTYYRYDGNGGANSFSCDRFAEICTAYLKREGCIKVIEENRIARVQKEIERKKRQLQDVSGWSLKRFLEQFGAEEMLSDEVRENKLLVFLLRRGYIDEKYANYINYFKGNTVTKEDMNFILSVKNLEPQSFNYQLTKTSMVVQRLQTHEFSQKEIYNFALLEYMLSDDAYTEKQNIFIKQLANEDAHSWAFIDEFVDLTKHQNCFVEALALAWPNMWDYIAYNTVLTYQRRIHYLSLLISNVDIETLGHMNHNNAISDFFEQNDNILQQLASLDSEKVIAVIGALNVIFRELSIKNVSGDVLDYIFDNSVYELNSHMIRHVVEHKNADLIPELELRNYTTIIKLGYTPLIEYVRENLSQYVETIVLAGDHAVDEEEQICDLLGRSIDNQVLCAKIIVHEEFVMKDIECCCKDKISEHKSGVKSLWNILLKNNKVLSTWENIDKYWSEFGFSQDLIAYIENHVDDLVGNDNQCTNDDFIRELIASEINDIAFEILLPSLQMESFDVDLASISEIRVSLMINCKFFEFTVDRYNEIKNIFSRLCAGFILQNQDAYISNMDSIQMDADLLEDLLLSDKIEEAIAQRLLDAYCTQFMTSRIAENLHAMQVTVSMEIFDAAWSCIDASAKRTLMLTHLELLDADAFHSCFTELEQWYSDFIDRSKRRNVELPDTPENRRLVARLMDIGYITSHELAETEGFDSVKETKKVRKFILCRVKAVP